MIEKRTVMFGAVGGMTVGAVIPWLWGDYNSFGMASVLCSMVGGFAGIYIAIKLSQLIG